MTWEFCWYFQEYNIPLYDSMDWYFQEYNIPLYDSMDLFESIYDWAIGFEKWYEKQDNLDYIEEVTKFSQKKIEEYLEESIFDMLEGIK